MNFAHIVQMLVLQRCVTQNSPSEHIHGDQSFGARTVQIIGVFDC